MNNRLLDEFIEINECLKQLKEKKELNQFLIDNFENMTEFQYNVIENNLEGIAHDIYYYKTELNKFYGKGVIQMEKLELMQWGLKRSVVSCVNIETGKQSILLIDNDYLMFLDEMGLIQ